MVAIGVADVLRVIEITAFAGGTTFLGIWISKKINFSEDQILALTAFGAGILISAAIFSMVIEAEKGIRCYCCNCCDSRYLRISRPVLPAGNEGNYCIYISHISRWHLLYAALR